MGGVAASVGTSFECSRSLTSGGFSPLVLAHRRGLIGCA
jgi:hypothetical protein